MKIKPPKTPLKKISTKSKINSAARQIKESINCKNNRKTKVEFLPSGSTLLNLAISNTTDGGWPRARVSNIVGDGSSGKCCRDCIIMVPDYGMIYIDDLCKELPYGQTEYPIDLIVEKGKVDSAFQAWKERVHRIVQIETEYGFAHEITRDHKLKTLSKDNVIEMKKAGDLQIGDSLLISKNTQVFSKELFNINGVKITKDFSEFIAMFLSMGIFQNLDIEIVTTKKENWEKIIDIAAKLNLNLTNYGTRTFFGDKYFAETIYSLFDNPVKFDFSDRFIPQCIFQSPKEVQIQFLKTIFELNSWRGDYFIEFNNSSKRLTKEIQLILLNLGIVALRGTDYTTDEYYYQLIITNDNLKKFIEIIDNNNFRENKNIVESSYFFDPIKSIGEIFYNTGIDVFDFYIPENHLFWGNGFINHNTILALEGCYQYLKNIGSINSKLFPPIKKAKAIYNNGEGVMDFAIDKMYGAKFNSMVDWRRSPNIEAAGRDFLKEAKLLKRGESLFYVMDSWDSFRSFSNVDITEATDEEVAKAYNFAKQIYAWKFFASVCDIIDDNKIDATLLVISQTRQKIGVTFGKKKYRTGGDALNFYTHLVPWIREVDKITKTKFGEERTVSILSEANIERTKVGLPFRKARFSILFDYGIDDVRSMATYLKMKKYSEWENVSLKDIHQFSVEVEKKKLTEKLKQKVETLWHKVESEFEKELMQRLPKGL